MYYWLWLGVPTTRVPPIDVLHAIPLVNCNRLLVTRNRCSLPINSLPKRHMSVWHCQLNRKCHCMVCLFVFYKFRSRVTRAIGLSLHVRVSSKSVSAPECTICVFFYYYLSCERLLMVRDAIKTKLALESCECLESGCCLRLLPFEMTRCLAMCGAYVICLSVATSRHKQAKCVRYRYPNTGT